MMDELSLAHGLKCSGGRHSLRHTVEFEQLPRMAAMRAATAAS